MAVAQEHAGETAVEEERVGIQPSTVTGVTPGHGAFPLLLFPAGFKQGDTPGAEVFAGADKVVAGIYKQPPTQAPEGHSWGWLSCILGWD